MARKLKQSVINSIPHLKENLEEEEKNKRRLKQSVYEEMPYLSGEINDDVAPVGGNKNSWFKSGGFSDGVDGVGDFFGDLGQTVGGTVGDLGLGILKGAGRLVEGVADLGTYGVAGVADLVGADDFADKAKKVAQYSAVDEFAPIKKATDFVDRYSVLGDKADMVSEGLGQVGAIILTGGAAAAGGVGSAGVAALTTGITGLSGMGSGMGSAYESGASDEDAFLYGLGAGAVEAGTELLFGGLGKGVKALGLSRGIGGLDDMFAKKLSSALTKAIRNESVQKVAGNTIEAAIKAGGEGAEEVLSGLGSAVMKKLTYEDDETLQKLIEDENLLEQFVVGSITSSIAQGADFVKANKSGRDFVTGYTNNEQAVIDKEVERRVSEQEKGGKKLTTKEVSAIEDQVKEDMEHGQLDIETIEEVLGGDDYKTFLYHTNNERRLKQELDELSDIKKSDLTTKQEERLAELKAMNLDDTTKREELRKKLNDKVFPQVKGSKFEESYNQIEKKKQAFKADLSQYKGKQREAVERAVKSGVLNDTYRSHVLVDTLSKIEADKGISFDYTNNAKLKETGFAVDGYTVNGYANKNTGSVTLNVQSAKAWQSVVGHEITHVLEDTESYGALQQALYAYANSKGELENRRTALTELYQDMADIDSELTADLVGDYLFTDKAFIDHLTGNRNLFHKIWDEIKYLCKVATGKELSEVEKVQREFDRAWKEYSNKAETKEYSDGDVKYSLRKEAPPKETGVAYKVFYVKDGKLYPPMVANPEGADTPMGVWLNADVGTAAPPSKTGRAQVKAGGKGTQGGSGSLAFRPGWHLGDLPRASQFDRLNPETGKKELFPENFVWAEVEYAKDVDYQEEAMSYGYTENGKFRHAYAGLPRLPENGYYRYRTNPKPDTVPWVITGAMKVNRLLSDAEVNEILEKNGVPPVHRQGGDVGLEKFGFGENDGVKYSLSSIANTFYGDPNMTSVAFEESDYKQTDGYKNYVEKCLNNMRQTRSDFDETSARQEIDKQIEGIVRVAKAAKKAGYDIYDDPNRQDVADSKNRLLFSSLEPNSEYFTSSDISTICDKRKNFAEIYDDIVRAEEAKGVPKGKRFFDNVDNYFRLHNIMAQKGLTQPCRQCYVESMRKNLAPMANAFLRLVNETNPDNKSNDQLYQQSGKNKGQLKTSNAKLREQVLATLEEHPEYGLSASDLDVETLTTEDGLAQLKIQAPLIYEAFNSFYGQSKPKMPKSATPFRFGELTALLTDHNGKIKQSLVERINSTGGFRLQSYSDFQIQNYTDVLQVIFEAGTMGLNGHAYTKVPAFLEATEGTNLKRNISIFMYKDGNEWKIDRNDSFPYALEEIYDIVNSDASGNTSIIAVSQNKEMSAWIMANDYVGQGIPFHKSGMKMGTVRDTDVRTEDGRIVKGYSGTIDHTKQQTEVWAKASADHKALTKVKNGINIYSDDLWDFDNKDNLPKNELIKKNLKAYIDACEEAGYLPKFRDYVMNNDSVLRDVLKYAKELGFAAQDATIDDISFEYKGYRIPYGYYKFLGDFGMFKPDGTAAPHDTLSLNDYDFDKAEAFFADAEGLRRTEILQQFANGEERLKYRDGDLTAEELDTIVKQKRQEVVDDVIAHGIRFSLSKSIEETKDLVAVHNMKSSELIKTLELGGLPMPSLAVIKAQQGHEKYGDVSLIFPKNTIDPQSSKYNKVYGGDAWTPTYPRIEYKASEAVQKKIGDKYYEITAKHGYELAKPLYKYAHELESALNSEQGETNLLDRLYKDTKLMQVYLADSGKGKVEDIVKETQTEASESDKQMGQWFVDKLGEDFIRAFKTPAGKSPLSYRKNYIEEHKAEIASAWEGFCREVFKITEEQVQNVVRDTNAAMYMKFMKNAEQYLNNGGVTIKSEVDYDATETAIKEKAADGYKEWVDSLFKGAQEKTGISNGKDAYTSSGNRRSWDALHWENTLENVVKAMRAQDQTGADAFSPASAIFAVAHKRYDSIDAIKADSNRLGRVSEEEYKAMEGEYASRLAEIARAIQDPNERNSFVANDQAAQLIVDAVRNYKTKSGMLRYMQKWNNRVTGNTVNEILSLVSDIANMPTGYFEAKPQRAVSLEEVGVFVIPRNTDVKLKQELLNRGFSIAEYDPNVEGDRQRVVNQFEEYKFSLSDVGEEYRPVGNYSTPLRDLALDDVAPVRDDAPTPEAPADTAKPEVETRVEAAPTAEEHPLPEMGEDIIKTVKDRLNAKIENSEKQLEETELLRDWVKASYEHKIEKLQAQYDSKKNKDTKVAVGIQQRIANLQRVAADLDADIQKKISDIESRISSTTERLQDPTKRDILEVRYERINERLEADKASLAEDFARRKAEAQEALADRVTYFSNKASDLYNEVRSMRKGVRVSPELGYILDNLDLGAENKAEAYKALRNALLNTKYRPGSLVDSNSAIERFVRDTLYEYYENDLSDLNDMDSQYQQEVERLEADAEKQRESARKDEERVRRSDLHENIVNNVKATFSSSGFDFDDVLTKAKNLSTFATVDNTPQRVMEKALGYKEGQVLSDLTVNKVAQNESAGIKWLNSFTDRKNGLIAQISKQYHIKPGSKESAAAQMYAEGFYVDDNNEIIAYGDAELAKDFPNARIQDRIKGLAHDPRIRQIYDETLEAINASRTRNAYPEIQKLDNYFLHFRAMDDTFSKLGLPFNPNDIRAKDLPTDLNGVTADLKPGQPYFASANHRTGKRTSFDLLGGLERYLTSAKNQIYHIDDIQTLRALRNYIADTYGQANGLEGIDVLSEEEAQERIEMVYNSHLSTFAKFLNEEANVLAGKTALIDRGLEGIIGRRGMTFLDTVNRQVGSNMVGFNISSSLTNFVSAAQGFAKTNKFDFVKAFAQTVSNKFGSVVGRGDNFAENSPVMIRRNGADRFYRTPWQKAGDMGYVLASAVDNISTELIARTKFNEFTRKGIDEQTAHFEADKWVSRLMGDRSLGQQPQLYNSKTLGVLTKFQLEVRNQLDSQFYDTIQEAKVSSEHIQNALARNARTAAKVTSTFVQLAVVQHLFGKAFESVAGYNPAFDIISTLATVFGFDDEEDSEDTVLDNIEQGFLELLEDLPYTSTFTGGRIPISSALPVKELVKGVDEYGNEKSRLETLGEAAPYYVLPGGYGQIKKTAAGLNMFSDEHPVSGSYTDSGKLRFPVEDTPENRVQAAVFGQYASENAREYFDNDYAPLDEKQIQEYIDTDMPIGDYRDYREGLKGLTKVEEKFDYISGLDLPVSKKNILANNVTDRKEPVDLTNYDDFGSLEEFDFANKNPEKYAFAKSVGGYSAYQTYSDALYKIKADKDASGKSISGSRKEKVLDYINNLDADYYAKIILFKSEYPSEDSYNAEIIEYLNGRDDLSYEDRVSILTELGFRVTADGQIYAD